MTCQFLPMDEKWMDHYEGRRGSRNEFPDEQIAFRKYEEFKKDILISMLIFLVLLKNCYLLFH